MADKNKRTVYNVQDVISGNSAASRPKFKSGYTGPKKAPSAAMSQKMAEKTEPMRPSAPKSPIVAQKSGGILDYAWIAYSLILAIALFSSVLAYEKGGSAGAVYYPHNVFTISGVVKDIFAEYKSGGLGSNLATQGVQNAPDITPDQAEASSAPGTDETSTDDNSALLGESAAATIPNSTTGATMALDAGEPYGDYSTAVSHEEVLSQLDKALSANDPGFVGTKLAYEDSESHTLIGYPQSVVEHFTQYMSENADKRATFLEEIKDASLYSAKNGSAYIVKLPLLQFTINMGYDGTTISISGFSDQKMDSGQSAIVSPLLPCMYTIHAETAKGSQTSEVECNMNEGNLKINIGVTN
ncbi:MAG: hypothetical protein J5367_08280 [Lachnospiraceae bacterium]|nr:hypothetical protein [Lachnospiraceae bacterium]